MIIANAQNKKTFNTIFYLIPLILLLYFFFVLFHSFRLRNEAKANKRKNCLTIFHMKLNYCGKPRIGIRVINFPFCVKRGKMRNKKTKK